MKFLTELRSDERARTRLRNEVRLARQLAHPNVCRVYDIGESHGDLYLSMEYVDGEDLAALLKRIGRLPIDKGIEIARKLCAGLAAAHAKGVLHRDFKPANIMIDSHGAVRIMDFGLAAVADRLEANDVRSGTPAYMAPEQLAGKEATKQSNLYALGLVLYEVFTGKAAFEAKSIEELLQLRAAHPATTPSTLIPDIGPRVERAILRCLEPNPAQRPASALEIAAFLPGGDPLADALAAGETPSPEIVTAAGPTDALRPIVAVSLLVSIGVGLAAWCWLTPMVQVVAQLPFGESPEVLAARGRDIAASLGYTVPPADTASGFREQTGYMSYVDRQMSGSAAEKQQRWSRLLAEAPSPIAFWYREADAPIVPVRPVGIITHLDPPVATPGTLAMDLGLDGRLLRFTASNAQPDPQSSPDWSRFFEAARLDMAQFQPAAPAADDVGRVAWTGIYPGAGEFPVRIEATASGQTTSFAILFPWDEANASKPFVTVPPTIGPTSLFWLVILVAVAVIARRNWIAGRVDRSGAWQIAVLIGVTLFLGTHLVTWDMANLFRYVVEFGLYLCVAFGVQTATFYLALEPWGRRYWPETLVTWSRVVAGRWRDPLVGRDVLIALLGAVLMSCAYRVMYLWITGTGGAPAGVAFNPNPDGVGAGGFGFTLLNLMGARQSSGAMLLALIVGLSNSLSLFFIVFLARVLFRRPGLSAVVAIAFVTIANSGAVPQGWDGWFSIVVVAVLALASTRYGFFTLAVWTWFGQFGENAMLTPNFGAWYGQSSLFVVVVITGTALWAFHTALGGQPVFASSRLAARTT